LAVVVMLAFAELYVSGFWTWLGLTLGIAIVIHALAALIAALSTWWR
jgi:hypothetical protein